MQRKPLVRPVMLALGSTLLWAMPAMAEDQTARPQADALAVALTAWLQR